jgi:hypothetical protein
MMAKNGCPVSVALKNVKAIELEAKPVLGTARDTLILIRQLPVWKKSMKIRWTK